MNRWLSSTSVRINSSFLFVLISAIVTTCSLFPSGLLGRFTSMLSLIGEGGS